MKTEETKTNSVLENDKILKKVGENYRVAASEYSVAHRKARILDATDRNKLWEAVNAKFPNYQVLSQTNHVSYIKNNILASIYTVGKSARILPTSQEDKEIVEQLNIAMDYIWQELQVGRYQMMAGERAALMNYGITQVGWDNNIVVGNTESESFQKGKVVLKNINPLKFMRDPFSENLETAAYCMTWDDYHKSAILANPLYSEEFKKYLETNKSSPASDTVPTLNTDKVSKNTGSAKGYFRIFTHWYRNKDGSITEVHTVNNEYILKKRDAIQPAMYPFAELYCNLPAGDLFGTSEPAKIFMNSVAYNIMMSMLLTAEYKNQRPPRFVSGASGINVASFTKHGNDADRTFVVSGDPSKAVSYQSFPQVSQQAVQGMGLISEDIKNITGVDDRYTGRDTGSVLTTGGIENMLDQVTMIDAPKVENYEAYSKRLTNLILANYIQHSSIKRNYFTKDRRTGKWKGVTVEFPDIDVNTVFNYEIMISTELPKNKTRLESVANHLMEIQMQYQGQGIEVDLITPEEWLSLQDLPIREMMQERMGIQRTENWTKLVAQAVTQYSSLLQTGMPPEQAIAATADTMMQQSQPGGMSIEEQGNMMQQGLGAGVF